MPRGREVGGQVLGRAAGQLWCCSSQGGAEHPLPPVLMLCCHRPGPSPWGTSGTGRQEAQGEAGCAAWHGKGWGAAGKQEQPGARSLCLSPERKICTVGTAAPSCARAEQSRGAVGMAWARLLLHRPKASEPDTGQETLILPALPVTDRISAREARGALDQQLPRRGCACVPARAHPVHSACYSPFCGDAGPRAEGARLAEGRQRQKVLSIQSRPLGVTSSGTRGMDARSLLELPQAARISLARRELQPPLPLAASTPGQKEMASQGSSHVWHAAAAAALVPAVLRQGCVAALLPGGVPAWRGCAVAGKQLIAGAWPWLEERSGAEHP